MKIELERNNLIWGTVFVFVGGVFFGYLLATL